MKWHFEISPMMFVSPIVCDVAFNDPQRLGALGLWTLCGSWVAGAEVSDRPGFVPSNLPEHLTPAANDVGILIEHGFWNFAQDDAGQLGYQMGYQGELWRMRKARSWASAGQWIEPARRRALYERDGWACQVCKSLDRLSLDHKLPRTRGGSHDDSNLWTLCRSCNSRKGTRTVEEWLGVSF